MGFCLGFLLGMGQWLHVQMKLFFNSTGQLWKEQKLAGKPSGIFVSTGTQGGGQETIALKIADYGLLLHFIKLLSISFPPFPARIRYPVDKPNITWNSHGDGSVLTDLDLIISKSYICSMVDGSWMFEWDEVEAFVRQPDGSLFSWCERFCCFTHLLYGIVSTHVSFSFNSFSYAIREKYVLLVCSNCSILTAFGYAILDIHSNCFVLCCVLGGMCAWCCRLMLPVLLPLPPPPWTRLGVLAAWRCFFTARVSAASLVVPPPPWTRPGACRYWYGCNKRDTPAASQMN
ncbi:hypothetical protein IFM89_015576 [Coptis chinensis]|uniref:Uncharacterized protein n=1 Tax=Coptis chinensis TaxID=261450 RepID=A0A835I2I6_9MAGN|nr:hypothetical protein IFM89_015576 [Coptis chinensis]